VAQNDEDRRNAGELISSSWICHDYDPGLDMEFYEILKKNAQLTCPIVFSKLKDLKEYPDRGDRLVSTAALLVLLDQACPGQSPAELEDLKSNFKKRLETDTAEYNEGISISSSFYHPWQELHPSIATAGPFQAKDLSWRQVTFAVFNVFFKRSPVTTAVMWRSLDEEGLPAKLIFGQFILYFAKDAPLDRDARSHFDTWVELGLAPVADPESKFAAIASVANLDLKNHKESLQRVANSDTDPILRHYAGSALTYTFSSRIYNPPSELPSKP
jgi:hypothetical protein